MLVNYGYIGLFLVVAIFFAVIALVIPVMLRFLNVVSNKPNPVKNSTYECGMETIGEAWVQFNFRYYFYALMFIVLDVLVVFIYLWAVSLRQLGSYGFFVMLVFITFIVVGYIYAWRKGVLEWK